MKMTEYYLYTHRKHQINILLVLLKANKVRYSCLVTFTLIFLMDSLLEEIVGSFGPWQVSFIIKAFLINSVAHMVLHMHLFSAYTPEHRYTTSN